MSNTIDFSKLTVGQYQELYRIHKSDMDTVDKTVASVSLLTGTPRWEVEECSLRDLNAKAAEIVRLFTEQTPLPKIKSRVKLNGQLYELTLDANKITAGQYIDLQYFISQGVIVNLHRIIACLLTPIKKYGPYVVRGRYNGEKHESVAEAVLGMNFLQANAVSVFFLNLWNNTIVAMEDYLVEEVMKKMGTEVSREGLADIMHGFLMQNEYPILSESN